MAPLGDARGFNKLEKVRIIEEREEAIKYAIHNSSGDDIVLIAGKGHEDVQIIGDKTIPFLDKAVVQSILASQQSLQQGA